MDAPKCKRCEKRHYGLCSSIRRGGADIIIEWPGDASNTASNIDTDASNKKQRWDRDKYNEYQRGYMRRKRHGMQGEEG